MSMQMLLCPPSAHADLPDYGELPAYLRRPDARGAIATLEYIPAHPGEKEDIPAKWRLSGSSAVVLIAEKMFSGAHVTARRDSILFFAWPANFDDLLAIMQRYPVAIDPGARDAWETQYAEAVRSDPPLRGEGMKPSRPVVRWHGGKWLLAPWIISHFPQHRIYVEPFGGGGSVLLRKPRAYAEVYNDLDQRLVTLFRVLRDRDKARRLIESLELTPFARAEFEEAYREGGRGEIETARALLVKCLMGFGTNAHGSKSGFRANSNRSGTTPAHDWRSYPQALVAIVDRLRGVVIENRPALEVMRQHDGPDTLHYLDPPYLAETRDRGRDYEFEMSDADHRELLAALGDIAGAVVISGYRSPLYDQALGGWRRVERVAMADGARKRVECLWLNECAQRLAPAPMMFGEAGA